MRPDSAVDLFLSYARVERGLSENTLAAYGRDLNALVAHLDDKGVGSVHDVKTHHVLAHLVALGLEFAEAFVEVAPRRDQRDDQQDADDADRGDEDKAQPQGAELFHRPWASWHRRRRGGAEASERF